MRKLPKNRPAIFKNFLLMCFDPKVRNEFKREFTQIQWGFNMKRQPHSLPLPFYGGFLNQLTFDPGVTGFSGFNNCN